MYEPLTLDFLTKNLAPGDIAVLAGVNFGQHVAVAARAIGDSGLVLGIEPQPSALLRASANLANNGLSHRVNLISAALGEKEGFIKMSWSDPRNSGAASLLDEGAGINVQVVRLDSIFSTFCDKPPRLLLLDIQGFEGYALAGMSGQTLPSIIVLEIDPTFVTRANTTVSALLELLKSKGYLLHTLKGDRVVNDQTQLVEANVVGVLPDTSISWSA